MKHLSKCLSMILATLLLAACLSVGASAAAGGVTVTNPYAGVNWETYGAYRGNLHTHSTLSDGGTNFSEMVEHHYDLGYDFLAMTDHGTVDRSWTQLNSAWLLKTVMDLVESGDRTSTPLTQARWEEISTGADRDDRGMLRVPFGIEHNPTSLSDSHVNSFFADVGHGLLGGTFDYETPVREVDRAGGLCVLNHVGRYTNQDGEVPTDAYEGLVSSYHIFKMQRLLEKYPALLGLDINSKRDGETRNDRKLWDKLLMNLAPSGRQVFALATSDTHSLDGSDTGFIWALMPVNNAENLKACLRKGAFFAAAHDIKNPAELAQWAGETGLTLGEAWSANRQALKPMITKITEQGGVITLTVENDLAVHWISGGKVISTEKSIDLNDCGGLGAYVRAEVFGHGGVLYTQAFLLEYEGMPGGKSVPWYFVDLGGILAVFRRVALWFM